MSQNWYKDVCEQMQEVYEHEVKDRPTQLNETTRQLRSNLCWEEFQEFMLGLGVTYFPAVNEWMPWRHHGKDSKPDLAKLADGAMDLFVVVLGTLAAAGIDPQELWNEVHRTNMAKADGPIREDGKRLKPPGWKPPDIEGILRRQGWKENGQEETERQKARDPENT